MSSSYTTQWKQVENTINDRLLDDSLLHSLNADKKIKKQTKSINEKLKKFRNNVRSYEHFIRLRRQAARTCESNDETDDEAGLSYEAYKKLYSQQPKSQLRIFLRTCTRTPRKPHVRKTQESNESPTCKRPSLSKANVPKNQVKPIGKTSISSSKSSKSKLSSTDNNGEKKCIKNIVDDLISSNIQKKTVDSPSEFLTVKVKSAAVEDTAIVDDISEELAASELKYDIKDSPKSCYGLVNESKVSSNKKQDISIAICDVTDKLNASNSPINSIEIPKKNNLLSQEDIFMTDDEKLSLEENLDGLNDDEKCINVLYSDSGNHSCSDTNILRDEYPERPVDITPSVSDYHDKGIITEHCFNNEDESIPTDNILELVNNVTELNKTVDMVSSDNDLNISPPEFRRENSMGEEILSDHNLDSEASQEIPFAKPICYPQLKDEFSTESTTNDTRIKLKIRTIEQYNKGYEIFSTYQSHKQKKFKTVTNFMENKSPSKHEQPLKLRKFSEDFDSSESKSQHLNGLIDHAHFSSSFRSNQDNVDKSPNNKFSLEVEEQLGGDISEIQSHHLNQSLNSSFSSFSARSCNENLKNSVKTQLLSEIELRLKDSPTSKNRSSHTQSQTSNGSFHDHAENLLLSFNSSEGDVDQFIDAQRKIKDDGESLESNRSTTELTSSEIHPRSFIRSSNIQNSMPSLKSTPTKRRTLDSEKEYCSLENTLRSRKLPRLDKQSTNRQLELISDERKSQGSVSHEMQLTKEEDDSLIQKREKLNTCKNIQSKKKKSPRPRNLEEFVAAEALTRDITEAHFRLKDISEDDEIWIMDVPKTINPRDFEDQMILLGGKRELSFGDDCYKVSSKPTKGICNVSCIFTTSRRKKQYKIVNVEPKGNIKFHKKLSVVPEIALIPSKVPAVPFPKNLKIRHPLFGAAYKEKIQ